MNIKNLKIYWNYFKYVMEHKKNVFIECWKDEQYLHAFTHDLSKFSRHEFIPYAKYFFIDKEKYKYEFETAWVHHYKNNPHHWNYWCDGCKDNPVYMPKKYVRQMICDWEAMGRKFGNSAQEYYLSNKSKIILHESSRRVLEELLGIK